ncbi:response regulator [Flavobacterium petrolei]|uniref:Response regulator n=1 Tax=Flavobacterium petrolei TaxID=2259594 RepID=A0A482TIA2_9FLAO|nr:response regulator [Flavobacterium petrolei]RYJ51083.1 response regulator [Flavobacterium petrolei]
MVGANILLVDSNRAHFENTLNVFSQIGIQYNLCFAKDDIQAWLMLTGDKKLSPLPKIMLIDINAEGINGIKLIEKIRLDIDLKSTLIFVISDINNDKNKRAALNLNIAGYINRSFEIEEMINFFSILNDYWNNIEFSS